MESQHRFCRQTLGHLKQSGRRVTVLARMLASADTLSLRGA